MSDLACKVLHTCSELGNSNHSTGEGKVTVTIFINSNFRLACCGKWGVFVLRLGAVWIIMLVNQKKLKVPQFGKSGCFVVQVERSDLAQSSRIEKFFSSVRIHYSQSLPSLIVKSEFRKLIGPKFTRKFGFLHRIANSNTLSLLNSPLSSFPADPKDWSW